MTPFDPQRPPSKDVAYQRPRPEIADLIGVPYVIGGRGPCAYDCAGLVLEMQRRHGRKLHIPETGDSKLSDHRAMRLILGADWLLLYETLSGPPAGSVVFFPNDAHVGTMIDSRRFLHTTSDIGYALVESLTSPFWSRKRREFWTPR